MPTDHARRLSRREASEYLTAHGFKTAVATLAKLACVGGGPPFESFGRRPLYREADLLAWAQARLIAPRRTTSEPRLQQSNTDANAHAADDGTA